MEEEEGGGEMELRMSASAGEEEGPPPALALAPPMSCWRRACIGSSAGSWDCEAGASGWESRLWSCCCEGGWPGA